MKTYLVAKKLELRQTPIILHIAKENGKGKVGRAVIREGSLIWYPGNAKKGHRVRWEELADLVKTVPKRKRMKVRGK